MAITSLMAKMTVRSTFALDPETVDSLGRLARLWGVSKSEALRRVVNLATAVEDIDASADALGALDELQRRLGLDEQRAEAWIRRVRDERAGQTP
jgi:hypothetical protein